ncbi:MAG: hypothetical protein A2Y38_21840 [Spirochaetes bacterium GWB1_59_5]|nr:MAG: hypothetical protein A2Y38_21840 [Spirochaetes bacterium GWB1_59_5]
MRQPPVDPDLLLHLGEQAVFLPALVLEAEGLARGRKGGLQQQREQQKRQGDFGFHHKPLYNNIVPEGAFQIDKLPAFTLS